MRLGRLNNVEITNDPATAADAGDGFVMRHGYAIAANSCDYGATGTGSMKISVPRLSGLAGPSYEYIVADNATTTGFNLRMGVRFRHHHRLGAAPCRVRRADGCESDGQNIPFARTKAERKASGAPRKSLEKRYKYHGGYVKAVAKAARKLQKDGFLIQEDVDTFISEAQQSDALR